MKREKKIFFHYISSAMIGMLIAGSFSIVDTIFIGRGTGKLGLSAVALTWPPLMLFCALGDMIGTSAGVLISQARGIGDAVRAQRIFGNMLTLLVVVTLIFGVTLFIYLEPLLILLGATAELLPDAMRYSQVMILGAIAYMLMGSFVAVIRNDKHPFMATGLIVIGLTANIILDWLFIMALNKGVMGAAVATIISQFSVALVAGLYFFSGKTKLRFNLKSLVPKIEISKEILFSGIPIFGNMFSIIAMLFMHNYQSLKYGGIDGLASYTLIATLESLGSMLMTGLAAGMQPLTAYLYGAGKHERKNRIGNYAYRSAFIVGIILMLLSFALHDVMPAWVGLSGSVSGIASRGIILSAPAFLLLGVIRVAGFYYQSTGKIAVSSTLIYGDAFFALPLCLFTLPCLFGMDGVWLSMPISRVILFAGVCYFWFFRKQRAGESSAS